MLSCRSGSSSWGAGSSCLILTIALKKPFFKRENSGQKPGRRSDSGIRSQGTWTLETRLICIPVRNVSHTGRYVWFLPRETQMARVIQNILLLKISVTVEPCKLSLLQLRPGGQAVLAGSHFRSEKVIFPERIVDRSLAVGRYAVENLDPGNWTHLHTGRYV